MPNEHDRGAERLPAKVAWRSDGHLSDVAVTAVADAELALLAGDVLTHVEGCDACAARVAAEVDLGVALDEALQEAEVAPATGLALDVPRLRGPLAMGLAVALLGLLPSLGGLPAALSKLTEDGGRWLGAASLILEAVGKQTGGSTALTLVVAAVLIAVGVVIARRAPRQSAMVGGNHG